MGKQKNKWEESTKMDAISRELFQIQITNDNNVPAAYFFFSFSKDIL